MNRYAPFKPFKPQESPGQTDRDGLNGLNHLNGLNTLPSGSGQKRFHFTHGLLHADQHRPGDDAVADVELDHLWNSRYRQDIVIIEAMAAMDFEAQPLGELRAGDYLAQFLSRLAPVRLQ